MSKLKCPYVDCGRPLTRTFGGVYICPDNHCYHVRRRAGEILDAWPASGEHKEAALEIIKLRGAVKTAIAALALWPPSYHPPTLTIDELRSIVKEKTDESDEDSSDSGESGS